MIEIDVGEGVEPPRNPLQVFYMHIVAALSAARLSALAAAYDKLSDMALQPFPDMAQDPVRISIDRSISQALNLPDFSILREMLAREPVVCLRGL